MSLSGSTTARERGTRQYNYRGVWVDGKAMRRRSLKEQKETFMVILASKLKID